MREIIILACGECKRRNYSTTKNRRKQSGRVEYKKHCPFCNRHTVHKEAR
jgi:large subunit ribosomal protein L33